MNSLGLGINKANFLARLENLISGLQLLVLPNRDLAGGWTSDNKVVQDYSQGGKQYGSELVVNGEFTTDSWWTKTHLGVTISGGSANWDGTQGGGQGLQRSSVLTVGKRYRIELDITSYTNGALALYNGTYIFGVYWAGSSGHYAGEFEAQSSSINIFATSGAILSLDNVSIKEITNGNHGIYKNSMELNQTAGLKYYTFDGTDDYIECSSPVNFTSNFTLISIFKTSASGIRVIYGNGDFGLNDRGYTLFLDDGVLRYGESSTGADYIQYRLNQTKSYADGAVQFVALTKNSTTHKFYDSGEEKAVALISGTPVASLHQATAPLIIGAIKTSGVPSGFHNGTQGLNIAVNQTLTQAQIKQIFYSAEVQSIIAGM